MAAGRKVVYFLGAGASVAAGAYARLQGRGRLPIPTRKDFWAAFFRLTTKTKGRDRIESFLFRYFLGYSRFRPASHWPIGAMRWHGSTSRTSSRS